MKSKKDVTIYDIAQMLSLSSATVSRGLRNHPAINKNTRKRIQQAARELGYRHNTFASSLRKQKTSTIGVIVHELNSNFITSVLAGIEKVTSDAGYGLIIAHSSESFKKEVANALNLFHKRVDGVIASLAFDTKGLDHFGPFEEKGIPVIFFDRVEEKSNYTKVIIDNYKCGYQATEHLIGQGCKRIVLITANLKRNVYAQRHQGYLDALFDHNISFGNELVLIMDLSEQGGIDAALEIFKMNPRPDGAFITNDFSAAVCMQTLRDNGVRIPADIAMVGFNNDVISKIVEPQLTTVYYPGSDMGDIAARNLINHLKGVQPPAYTNHSRKIGVDHKKIVTQKTVQLLKPIFQINSLLVFLLLLPFHLLGEDGYDLWLRYKPVDDPVLLSGYRNSIREIWMNTDSPTLAAANEELQTGLTKMLGMKIPLKRGLQDGTILAGTLSHSPIIRELISKKHADSAGREGYIIRSAIYNGRKIIIIAANHDIGVLYGTFNFLRLLQMNQPVSKLDIISTPSLQLRLLNHWDNLNRYVERGYAGISIWNWHTLPDYEDPKYRDYARANASIGINGVSLTNVNANAMVLTRPYLLKVASLADIVRPYGIKVYLTTRFSAPMEIGRLRNADPLNDTVQLWWNTKAREIYDLIPDFGGFLVKANSEGQPGPQNFGRSHADGANMLADAVAPYHGIVMWRAFVYSQQSDDRFKQSYDEFFPLDGKFRNNVMLQVKNGPIDFQPREPFSPLFGAMKQSPLMMEFQLTQEYLGQGTHLVYEAPMFREVLQSDTYASGKGSLVAKVVDGSLYNHALNGMAGVSNIGNERNWTGHLFGQANWYSFGRMAWDLSLSSEQIADEWIRQTFNNNSAFVSSTKQIMLASYEALVNYMSPLGLHHIMGNGHHYGPAPWSDNLPRADWNPVYFHKADSMGIGFDRTKTGTNALAQYASGASRQYEDLNSCDEKYLLWFHHVSWKHKMKSGRTFWEELCYKYYWGVEEIKKIQLRWDELKNHVDKERFDHVQMMLGIQVKEAIWWRNACLLYFQTFSGMPIPAPYEQPDQSLEYYRSLKFPYAPGN